MIATPPPAPQGIPLEVLMPRAWVLFKRNWIVALPPIIALLVIVAGAVAVFSAVFAAAFTHLGTTDVSPVFGRSVLLGCLVFFALVLAVSVWAQAAMFGMADAAWAKGTATFGDGFAAFRTRGGAVIVAFVGLFGVGVAAIILAPLTLVVSLLALPLFTMYVLPSVVTGGRDGFTAIGESFRLVRHSFATSGIALLVLLGIQYGISMVASAPLYPIEFAMMASAGQQTQPHLPPVGLLVFAGVWFALAMVVAQAYTGFYTIAIVGLYRSLFAQPGGGGPPAPIGPA